MNGFLDEPCLIHAVLINSYPTHSLRDCWVVRQMDKGGPTLLAGTSCCLDQTSGEDEVLMIYGTFTSNNKREQALR